MFRRIFPYKVNSKHDHEDAQESPWKHTSEQARNRKLKKRTNSTKSISSSNPSIQTTESVISNKSSVITIHLSVGTSKPSVSNQYNIRTPTDCCIPRLNKTPWELRRHKSSPALRNSRPINQLPGHTVQKLPKEVYECIIEHLEQIHLSQSQACSSCYLKDLYHLSLTSRAWDKAATSKMYRRVFVLANEDHPKLPKMKIRGAGRLKLLRRTLLERNTLARCVRELDLSDFQPLYQDATIDREGITNLVASLVMACPQLERLVGFHIPYTHSFDRLSHALSTRSKLKERMWLLAEPDVEEQEADAYDMSDCCNKASNPTERFFELNSNHSMLTTLVLHQNRGQISLPLDFCAVIGTIRQFPLLENLSISGLAATSFTNATLAALPPNLRSLRLEYLPGVSEKGFQEFIASPSAVSIERLKLINLEITSLVTIANIFSSHLANLRCFALVQHQAPGIPAQTSIPDFQSSVRQIHWEIRSQAGPPPTRRSASSYLFPKPSSPERPCFPFTNAEPLSCLATSILATRIQDGAFPLLERIRIPHDPQGLVQAQCKPLATALLPSDALLFASSPQLPTAAAFPTLPDARIPPSSSPKYPRADSPMCCATSPAASFVSTLMPMQSRLAAQNRILAAQNAHVAAMRACDREGSIQANKGIRRFVGHVDRKIVYELSPDRGCTAEQRVGDDEVQDSYWIVGVGDVTEQRQISGMRRRARRVCNHSVGSRMGMGAVGIDQIF